MRGEEAMMDPDFWIALLVSLCLCLAQTPCLGFISAFSISIAYFVLYLLIARNK
jgi:hypothetical protein